MSERIFLVGFMGAGKSTVGKLLAEKLDRTYVDTDEYIEKKVDMNVMDYFREFGEPKFREVETEALIAICEKDYDVISCGGGIVLKDENYALMRSSGAVIYLKNNSETIYDRIKDDTTRPLLTGEKMSEENIKDLLSKREQFYEDIADVIIDCDEFSPDEIVEMICKNYKLEK